MVPVTIQIAYKSSFLLRYTTWVFMYLYAGWQQVVERKNSSSSAFALGAAYYVQQDVRCWAFCTFIWN